MPAVLFGADSVLFDAFRVLFGEAPPPDVTPTGPPTYPWTLFRGVVINPQVEWSKGILHLTLECRDYNRVWRRTKMGVPVIGNFLTQPDGTKIEVDPAAGSIYSGPPELLDGTIIKGHVEHYWPIGGTPNTADIQATNPDFVALTAFQKWTSRTDVGSFFDEFIGYQDPYARYHLDADHRVWYRKLAPVGEVSGQAVPAPWAIVGDPADLAENTILANISASWDMDRVRRRLFVRGKTSESSAWFENPLAPIDAGEEYIEAPGAITADDAAQVAAWHFANKYRAFLTGTAEIVLPSNSDGDFYGFDGFRVGQTLLAKDRQLARYTTHPMSDGEAGFLATIITAVAGQLAFGGSDGETILEGEGGDGFADLEFTPDLALGITLNSVLLDDYIVGAVFRFNEQGFAQPGSATVELWLWDPDQTIEIIDLAPIVITTNGKSPLTYTLTFGDIEPGTLASMFAKEPYPSWVYQPTYHFETFYQDPNMPPGGGSHVWFQLTGADNKPVTGAGVPGLLSMLAWADEDETVVSDEYTLVDEGSVIETNVYGQIYSTVIRASSPSVPAVKWDADAEWIPA